jgi:hypothetical protein
MAKAKEPARETLVETVQDNDFGEPEPVEVAPRGSDLESDMAAIREKRAKERAARGPVTKRRRVTNYHDAERLANLVKAHPHLATPEEVVDWEEAGLLPDPKHYATGSAGNEVDG